jgi:hypothetical protein
VCCTCPDSHRGGHVCKHSRAVRLHEAHERDIERAFRDLAASKRQRVVPLRTYSDLFPAGLYD